MTGKMIGSKSYPIGQAPPIPEPKGPMDAMMGMTMDVAVDGRRIAVTGSTKVYEHRMRNKYVWSLRVYRGEGRLIRDQVRFREHHYTEREFSLADGQDRATPQFADALDLPPGTYTLELYLYAIRPGFDFRKFQPGEDLTGRTWLGVGSHRRIVVGE